MADPLAASDTGGYPEGVPAQRRRGQSLESFLKPCEWRSKKIILVRHGRSEWNELMGVHKKREWAEQEKNRKGYRAALKGMLTGRGGNVDAGTPKNRAEAAGPEVTETKSEKTPGFWKGVRGGVKQVTHFISQADKLHHVDHCLSAAGLDQARALRRSIAELIARQTEGATAAPAANELLKCCNWHVSPYLRALLTAGFCLGPLYRQSEGLKISVTPLANEIMNSSRSMDCQGKPGNVGHRVLTRAVQKVAGMMNEETDESDRPTSERQMELADVCAVLCSMDYSQVEKTWWKDINDPRQVENNSEDERLYKLISRLLADEASTVGVVGHSLAFRRVLQLMWPQDPAEQEHVRLGLLNGASGADILEPTQDKMMNCGVLVLTVRYAANSLDSAAQGAEVIDAVFLFDGHMESALAAENQMDDSGDSEDGDAGGDRIE
eukprot:TRINITY_DN34518_c0_g1_i1.p1 TRINITY_DN34518_c0_g1~~TRINITY_DN34518_c0_g1_i1.p1  ORF type:complete len:460 (-),score=69.40 TRINITY_DN34518_c0_g1_i1:49-1359(-)